MRGNPPGATGKSAEENSVTFSLSALMAQTPQAPTKATGAATKDDSGLIDLNALSAMEDGASKGAGASMGGVMPSANMGLFPFDALTAPAPAAQPVVAEIEPPKKSSRPWIVLGGVGVVVAAAAAFFVGMNAGTGDHAQGAPSVNVESAPSSAPAALEAAKASEPKIAAADPGAPKEAAKQPAKDASKPAAVRPTGAKAPVAKADGNKEPAKDAPKPAAAGDPCKGDLMCAMQRATKK